MKTRAGFKLCVSIAVWALTLAVMIGCAGGSESDHGTNSEGKKVVRVGYFPNLTHAQALVGLSDGTFRKALGSDTVIREYTFNAGPAEVEAILAGEIDIGYIGPAPAVNGFIKSRGGLRIIAGAADGGAVLVARKGINIRSVKDLAGKTVAVPQLGNTQDITLRNLLAGANLKDSAKGGTVTVVPAENADILTLISRGEIDAALVPEPWGSRIVKQAGARIVLDADQVWREGKYATAVVIVSTRFLNEHSDLVEKWLAAHIDLTNRINRNSESSWAAVNSRIKSLTGKSLPEDVLANSSARITVTYDPETESVREFFKIAVKNRYLKGNPDISGLFDLRIIDKVLAQKGLAPLKT